KMLGELNATLISLVPKIQTPIKVSDFRHIACCNVLYNCISNILTSRIKNGLKKLIQINQSAFIPRRVIRDNILLSQEILRGGRGLRQGDTLSPSLFTLIMEMLTLLLQRKIRNNSCFKYHHGCKELQLVNLCFTDDLMIFCNGDPISVGLIKEGLNEFSATSGLCSNLSKSTLFFGSLKDEEKEQFKKVMQLNEGILPSKYLGVPLITKRMRVKECQALIDKIKNRTENWKNKYLSYAGRLMLIAAMLESMSVYWASMFKLPKTVVKEVNSILKRFLWSNDDSAKGKAKIAWKNVCRPKEYGGLGIKNIESWNEALLSKLLWNIASKKDTL
ncbi:RNA-directed DNA polymerase, eukaryota, reverse transcriptase zinc-binding domain protein, partial [Tanacetum coccineum]